jgi:hypothetical protein
LKPSKEVNISVSSNDLNTSLQDNNNDVPLNDLILSVLVNKINSMPKETTTTTNNTSDFSNLSASKDKSEIISNIGDVLVSSQFNSKDIKIDLLDTGSNLSAPLPTVASLDNEKPKNLISSIILDKINSQGETLNNNKSDKSGVNQNTTKDVVSNGLETNESSGNKNEITKLNSDSDKLIKENAGIKIIGENKQYGHIKIFVIYDDKQSRLVVTIHEAK